VDKMFVTCPHCEGKKEVTPWTIAYRVRQFDQIRVTCTHCGQQFKILADIRYLTEK
jgi:hypothetical protein